MSIESVNIEETALASISSTLGWIAGILLGISITLIFILMIIARY